MAVKESVPLIFYLPAQPPVTRAGRTTPGPFLSLGESLFLLGGRGQALS